MRVRIVPKGTQGMFDALGRKLIRKRRAEK